MEKLRFYKEEFPDVDDLVMVRVGENSELGYTVYLLEYADLEGFVPLTEIVKWRVKKKKILSKGNIVPLVVIDVNRDKKHINLSKKKVRDDEVPRFEQKFKYATSLNKLMNEVVRMYGAYTLKRSSEDPTKALENDPSKDDICDKTLWKFFEDTDDYEQVYDTVLKAPKDFLDDLSPEFSELASDNIQKRIIKTWCSIEAEFFLMVISDEGVDVIKDILKDSAQKGQLYETRLKINSPKYTLCIKGVDAEYCSNKIGDILEQIKERVEGKGQMRIISSNTVTKEASYDLKFLSKKNLENFSF